MAWILVPCLDALRGEFDHEGPSRDRSSDGSIGDAAHRNRSSDHNPDETGVTPYEDGDDRDEVHAIDVDKSGPWRAGFDVDTAVEKIRVRHATRVDDRLQNIIYKGRIASRTWGWSWRTYSGANPHTAHVHFSARYTTAAENDTSWWGVRRMSFDATEQQQIRTAARGGVWADEQMATASGTANPEVVLTRMYRSVLGGTDNSDWLADRLNAIEARQVAIESKLDDLLADPNDMGNPESHPLLIILRYAAANPPA